MPEMKRNFTKGKMNKDLDERLVPNGEYRDAMNIQVSTSEGSDVGTIQNVLGNTPGCTYDDPNDNPIQAGSTTVGSVSDEKNDALYWLVAGPGDGTLDSSGSYYIKKDMIMRTNPTITSKCEPVFVDIYSYTVDNTDTNTATNQLNSPGIIDFATVGMTATGYDASGVSQFSQVVTSVGVVNSIPSVDYNVTMGTPSTTMILMPTALYGNSAYVQCGGIEFAPGNVISQGPYTPGSLGAYIATGFYDLASALPPMPNLVFGGDTYLRLMQSGSTIVHTTQFNVAQDPYGSTNSLITLGDANDLSTFQQQFESGAFSTGVPYGLCGPGVGGTAINMLNSGGWTFSLEYILPTFTNEITVTDPQWIDEIDSALSSGGIIVSIDMGSNSWPPNSCLIEDNPVNSGVYQVVSCSDLSTPHIPTSNNPVNLSFSNDLLVPNSAVLAEDVDLSNVSTIEFSLPRVLKFQSNNLVLGVNIVDDMLFWTDNFTEPKKINILRSVEGTDYSGSIHTAIVNEATGLDFANYHPIQEEHITVIRKSPKNALTLEIQSEREPGLTYSGVTYTAIDPGLNANINASSIINSSNNSVIVNFSSLQEDDTVQFEIETDSNNAENFTLAWKEGDVILLKEYNEDGTSPPLPLTNWTIRGVITDWQWNSFENNTLAAGYVSGLVGSDWNGGQPPSSAPGTAHVEIKVLALNGIPPSADLSNTNMSPTFNYAVDLEVKKDPVFEDKFPRFSYRYKYGDGEYSTFAPWSDVGFLPSNFSYESNKGYNEGMLNNAKSIQLQGFVPTIMNQPIGKDVIEVDILYKEEGSPNVYVVETISPLDLMPIGVPNPWYIDTYTITSESIKYALPSNQFLRPWDNVPKKALAQDVTGSRIVYGNYEQNYDMIISSAGLYKKFKPEFTNILSTWGDDLAGAVEKSIKSLRDYKLGVVFTDDYGRETPILISESGGFKIEKRYSKNANRLIAGLKGLPPETMTYFKFFIKETSTEYYNLAMDRWYKAEDGNIWLAFPSNDRNKVDLETSLYFKKGNEDAVENTTKYKVLAIENEAPEFIKTRRTLVGTVTHDISTTPDPTHLFGGTGVGEELDNAPQVNLLSFTMNWKTLIPPFNGSPVFGASSLRNLDTIEEDLYIQFARAGSYSKKYKISEITKDDPATQYYVTLDTNLKDDINFIFDNANSPGAIQDQVQVLFSKAVIENKPKFDGRFFVKIENDGKIKSQIGDDSFGVNYIETFKQKIYALDNDPDLKTIQANASWSQGIPAPYNATLGYNNWYSGSMKRLLDFDFSSKVDSNYVGLLDNNYNGENFNFFYARQSYFGYSQYDHDGGDTAFGCNGGASIYPNRNMDSGDTDIFDPDTNYSGTQGCVSGVWFIDRSTWKHTSYSGGDGSVTTLAWANTDDMTGFVPNNNNLAAGGLWAPGSSTGPGTSHFSIADTTHMRLGFGGIMNEITHSWPGGPSNWNGTAEGFFSVGEDGVGKHGDANTTGFVNQFNSGNKFKWEHDPTETVYTFYNQIQVINRTRFSRHDMAYNQGITHGKLFLDEKSGSYHRDWSLQMQPSMDNTTGSGWDPTAPPLTFMPKGLKLQDIQLTSHSVWGSGSSTPKENYLIVDTIMSSCQNNSALAKYKLHEGMMLTQYNNLGNAPANMNLVVKKITYQGLTNDYRLDLGGYSEPLHYNGTGDITVPLVDNQNLEFQQVSMNGASNYTEHNTDYFYDYWKDTNLANEAGAMAAVGYNMIMVEAIEEYSDGGNLPPDPYVWETEPKEDTGLDIYYEISENNPITLNTSTITSAIPIGSRVENTSGFGHPSWDGVVVLNNISATGDTIDLTVPGTPAGVYIGPGPFVFGSLILQPLTVGDILKITKPNNVTFDVRVAGIIPDGANPQISTKIILDTLIYNSKYHLNWHNCFSFRNGVESNRIKDNFNLPYIINGVKASTTLDTEYKKERRKHGLIYSGIYNSTSGVNNLNQFIQAEKITKDINPIYGSIQRLKAGWGQGGDLIALCEDRVLKILANKDALFNADGNTNVTATNKVLGQAIPYTGEYGISKNPESFASESYRAYFTDKVRGTVMRLSMDGLTAISDAGMKDWFRDNLKLNSKLVGSFDDKKDEYNISLQTTTETVGKSVTFKENIKGWVSFKSFVTNNGISCANQYYTFNDGDLWKHHDEVGPRNTFYNITTASSFNVLLNEAPDLVKSFYTLNYEGSQTRVTPFVSTMVDDYGNTIPLTTDNEYYNLTAKQGWYVDSVFTNKESGRIEEFIEKEGKWFFYLKGEDIDHNLVDSSIVVNSDGSSLWDQASFAIQGIGALVSINVPAVPGCTDTTANNYNPLATLDDGSCTYDPVFSGCMEPTAFNYNPSVNNDDGSCIWMGCTDATAFNYQPAIDFPSDAFSYTPSSGVNGCPFAAPCMDDGSCVPVVEGCTDATQFNYNPLANTDDGSCEPISLGCLGVEDPNGLFILASNAINYAGPGNMNGVYPPVNTDDGSCQWTYCDDPLDVNEDDANAVNNADILLEIQYYILNPGNGGSIIPTDCMSGGCMDSSAINFDTTALWDDGTCTYGAPGCMDPNATTYDPTATTDDPSLCEYLGCLDATATNYGMFDVNDAYTYVYSGTTYTITSITTACLSCCEYPDVLGCTDPTAINYDPTANVDDGSCITGILGCTYGWSLTNNNNNGIPPMSLPTWNMLILDGGPNSGTAWGWLYGTPAPIPLGQATNFNPAATIEDGSCIFPLPSYNCVSGVCVDPTNGNGTYTDANSGGNPGDGLIACQSNCVPIIPGCMSSDACNYDPNANVDDGSCVDCSLVVANVIQFDPPTAFNTNNGTIIIELVAPFDLALLCGNIVAGFEISPPQVLGSYNLSTAYSTTNVTNDTYTLTWTNVGNVGGTTMVINIGNALDGSLFCPVFSQVITCNDWNNACEWAGIYYTNTPNNISTNSCQYLTNSPTAPGPWNNLCGCCQNTPNGLIADITDPNNDGSYAITCAGYGCTLGP